MPRRLPVQRVHVVKGMDSLLALRAFHLGQVIDVSTGEPQLSSSQAITQACQHIVKDLTFDRVKF